MKQGLDRFFDSFGYAFIFLFGVEKKALPEPVRVKESDNVGRMGELGGA